MDRTLTVDVVPHIPMLQRYALKLARNGADADDLVQDCLLRALARVDQFEPGTNLSAWLMTILRNLFFTRYQRGKRVVEVEIDPDRDEISVDAPQDYSVELLDTQAALRDLKPDQQHLIRQCGIEGLSYEEAAQIMGVSTGTIRSRLSRARSRLREQVAGRILPSYLRSGTKTIKGDAQNLLADQNGNNPQAQRAGSVKENMIEPEVTQLFDENKALHAIDQPNCGEKFDKRLLSEPATRPPSYLVFDLSRSIVHKAVLPQSHDISFLYFYFTAPGVEVTWRKPLLHPDAPCSIDYWAGAHRHPRMGPNSASQVIRRVPVMCSHPNSLESNLSAEQLASRGGAPPRPYAPCTRWCHFDGMPQPP